jgi:hypothetical protein
MIERIEGIDGTMIFRYHTSDVCPESFHTSNQIKGSDGAERTLAEWWDHIVEKTAYADADDTLSKELLHIQTELVNAVSLGGDYADKFKDAAGEYFKLALLDCIKKGADEEGIIERLKTKVESLSRSLGNTKWKKPGRAALGSCLLLYIEKHHDLPRDRNELFDFSKGTRHGTIPIRTISEHLSWFALDKLCATYHKD